jgi:tetratricopeptide (TPR) repeat protein
MFFSKLFTRDYSQLKAKGDKLFAAEHYAEARHLYMEAVEKLGSDAARTEELLYLQLQISRAANNLAELNIAEAEAAMRNGNLNKGAEHLRLSLELADDVSVREKAEKLMKTSVLSNQDAAAEDRLPKINGCATCSSSASSNEEPHDPTSEHLTAAEQFQLLVNTLPGDLPQRYCQLGEKFATAYLLSHTDQSGEALAIFQELLSSGENDIILYEAALLFFRAGEPAICEKLLKRALQINSTNPVCYLGLAQLFIDSERYPEAEGVLGTMLDHEILTDQALILLGDVHTLQSDFDRAIEIFTSALVFPSLKKAAAERLVSILATQGREEEAAYLAKTYLKGCC